MCDAISWGAVAGAGIGLIGGALASDAASDAAATQADAARAAAGTSLQASREANQLQAAALRQQLLLQAPQYRGGQVALSRLMGGMGLGPLQGGLQSPNAPMSGDGRMYAGGSPDALVNVQGPTYSNAAGETVDAQGNVVRDNTYGIGNINIGASQGELDAAAGGIAPDYFTREYRGEDLYRDPSYQFRLSEGERLMRARQAASGNRFSGQAMRDITNYGQEAASQEFGAANDRFMRNRAVLYDRLANLAGIGSGAGNAASAATGTAAGNMGSNLIGGTNSANNWLTGGAAASAAGQVGSTNALVGGVNSGLNNWYAMQWLRGAGGAGGNGNRIQPGDMDYWRD